MDDYTMRFSQVPAQLSRIALICARVYSNANFESYISWEETEALSQEVDKWQEELPERFLLQNLLSGDQFFCFEGQLPLCIVHMVHLECRLFAYKGKMQQSEMTEILRIPQGTLFSLRELSRQVSRIVRLIHRYSEFGKCWLVMSVITPALMRIFY